jgi:hypothetical protein
MNDRLRPWKQFPDTCPCCGYETIDGRGNYDICPICWWEDDGQDNDDANVVRSGPNSNVSLTRARISFLTHGLFQASREDLRDKQDSIESHVRKRIFEYDPTTSTICELEAGWTTTVAELDDNPDSSLFALGTLIFYRRRRLDKDWKPGAITAINWDDRTKVWRYRLNDNSGDPVEQWYDGALLRPSSQNRG